MAMSATRKATASAYLAVMLKVLVLMVVAYALDGKKAQPQAQPLFEMQAAFEQQGTANSDLKPAVLQALISVINAHDLNLEITVFGENIIAACARAATVAQLLQKSGIPTSSLRVIGRWNAALSSDASASDAAADNTQDRIIAVKRTGA